jgi:hypothetical protein
MMTVFLVDDLGHPRCPDRQRIGIHLIRNIGKEHKVAYKNLINVRKTSKVNSTELEK